MDQTPGTDQFTDLDCARLLFMFAVLPPGAEAMVECDRLTAHPAGTSPGEESE